MKFKLIFGIADYEFEISDGGVTVFGCDCSADMTDDNAEEIYRALEEYLKSKGRLSESTKSIHET
jgi:hypothetical protein